MLSLPALPPTNDSSIETPLPRQSAIIRPPVLVRPSSSSSNDVDEDMSFEELRGSGLVSFNRKNKEYAFWDDPNELVERLKLLIGEMDAGNTSHNNEIQNIIEELVEAGIIYS